MTTGKKVLFGLFALMFIGGGIAHFSNPDFYLKLIRYIIPAGHDDLEKQLVMLSGITEIVAGLLFVIPQTRKWGATFILLHLLAFLAVHVTMCFVRMPGEEPNVQYIVWPRLIIQFMLIYWIATFKTDK